MTLEELKREAKKRGYGLIKLHSREKLLPCVCGHGRRKHCNMYVQKSGRFYYYLVCEKCGLKSPYADTEEEAKEKWNAMIEKYERENR